MIKESERLRSSETLLDLTESKFKQLGECKHDLMNLKRNWGLISLIDGQFTSWKKTPWDQIDTDSLIAQARKIVAKQADLTEKEDENEPRREVSSAKVHLSV